MKSLKKSLLAVGCVCGLMTAAHAQDPQDQPEPAPAAAEKRADAPAGDTNPAASKDDQADSPPPKAMGRTNTVARVHARPSANGLLTMNFRGASLELVLNYLIDAAGFIVLPETTISGKVDVWSSQPVTKDKAVELLDHVLRKNGLAAIQDGQTLTICSLDDAKKKNIPTETHYEAKEIEKDDKIVTEIIPVRSVNAAQAIKELSALKSVNAEWAADEAGNAIVMTDARVNIRRMAEIINALDLASSGVNVVRVFALKYADSKTMVTVVKDLFPSQDARGGQGGAGGGFQGFRGFGGRGGGGGFPGFGGGGGGGGGGADGNAQARSPKVLATSDDRSNSLVVSAPDNLMSIIEGVVTNMDLPVTDVTEVHVFHLVNADPGEMVDLLASLFPDETNSNNPNQMGQQFRFGGFGGFGFGRGGGGGATTTDRMKKMSRVLAVADKRTRSVVVSAAAELMDNNIKPMIEQLDKSNQHKQRAYVISLQNASAEDVLQVMNDLFPSSQKSSRMGSGSQSGSPLTQRSTTLGQQSLQQSSSSGFGGTSFGSGR